MDKAEYKIKLEEINTLAERGDFEGAAKAADEIDWRHVKSVRTLCMIGEIYESVRRYDDSLRILEYAYKRSSTSKTVLYRLAEISVRQGKLSDAKKYINEFEQAAPNDFSRYILHYKVSRAENAPLDDQIAILKEYKDKEYTERWAYELAKLYAKNGQKEKCVEECDDMILWFSEGRYVTRAMELKMKFRPLTPSQQARYDRRHAGKSAGDSRKTSGGSDLTGIETVEKAVNAASENEDLEAAQVRTTENTDVKEGKTKEESSLASSIRAVLASRRPGAKDKKKEETKPPVKELEPESKDSISIVTTAEEKPVIPQEKKSLDELDLDRFMNEKAEGTKDVDSHGSLDLDKLFAETSSALAGEVASGNYELADTLESDRKTKKKPEPLPLDEDEKAGVTSDLTGRETDESLGLTREFHFQEDIARAIAGQQKGERTEIPSPEDAAKETVLKVRGRLAEPVQTAPAEEEPVSVSESDPVTDVRMTQPLPSGAIEDEGLGADDDAFFRSFGTDQATRSELLADESDMDMTQPVSRESLLNLSSVTEKSVEGSPSIVENIMAQPEVFERLPLEGRPFTENEKRAFSYFASVPGVDLQATTALADIHNNAGSKTSRKGNIVIMGRKGSGKTRLARGLILAACMDLHIKAAKCAVLVAQDVNEKDPAEIVQKLSGGFLVIEAAGALDDGIVARLNQAMEFRTDDLVVVLEDEKADMRALLAKHPEFAEKFTTTITVPVFTNDELVTFAKTYAKEKGYKLDELATLALYTMIGDNQKDAEPVTVGRVKVMIDKAIARHNRKIRLGRSTDASDGRILLREKDFNF